MRTSFLSNLLIVFALVLCGLCTYQWNRETQDRERIRALIQTNYQHNVEIQNYTNTIRRMDTQINELDQKILELKAAVRTNDAIILDLRLERSQLNATNDVLARQLQVFTSAFQQATNQLGEAYQNIGKLNDMVKEVAGQRDDLVKQLNQAITERNDLVKQYNDLVDKFKQVQDVVTNLQFQLSKAAGQRSSSSR